MLCGGRDASCDVVRAWRRLLRRACAPWFEVRVALLEQEAAARREHAARSMASIASSVSSYRNACPVFTAASNGTPGGRCSGAIVRIVFGSARRCRSAAAAAPA
ncbi:hypothetical protein WL27_12010 [Burkholderia multivorans]|nr:hypothetical protein WL27_12010 [Burkholderia multivorans]